MTELAWTLVTVALVVGASIGRLSKRTAPPPPVEDPRLAHALERAEKAEKKADAQGVELREWAASYKVLEQELADLKASASAADSAAEDASQVRAELDAVTGRLAAAEGIEKDLRAKVTSLEGQIAAGAGTISGEEFVDLAKKDNRIAVLTSDLTTAKGKIAELERRLRAE